VRYVAAAQAIAELTEAGGDRAGAYESLAVGFVTVADLLGKEIAHACFDPALLGLRTRWGPEGFDAVKRAYEARRRAAGAAPRRG
jgi:hypothetical protein